MFLQKHHIFVRISNHVIRIDESTIKNLEDFIAGVYKLVSDAFSCRLSYEISFLDRDFFAVHPEGTYSRKNKEKLFLFEVRVVLYTLSARFDEVDVDIDAFRSRSRSQI
ncbi:hypothetical protein ES703_31983 [subsurface metagenome]